MSALEGYDSAPLVTFEEALRPLISVVPGIEQMSEVILEKLKPSTDDEEPFADETASIMLYLLKWKTPESSFNFFLNKTINSQNRQELFRWFPYIRLFIFAMSKLQSIASRIVYRALKMTGAEQYSVDDTLIWHEFSSCKSTIAHANESIDGNEPRIVFIIDCSSAKDISGYSFDENTDEIILYPERQFKVISLIDYGTQLKLIQLQEIHPNPPLIQIPQTPYARMDLLEAIIEQYPHNKRLDFTNGDLTDERMNIIVRHAITEKEFEQVLLSKNNFTWKGSSILAEALKENKTLTYLNLSYNNLTDKGVRCLTRILARNNSKLERLSLHETGITDQSIPFIIDMLMKNTTLTWLYIGGNQISDVSVKHLMDTFIDHTTTLRALDLSHSPKITDDSVECLTEMLEAKTSLETLWINNCGISSDGKTELKNIVKKNRRFFLLFVDDTSEKILEWSKAFIQNGNRVPLSRRLV